MTCKPQTTLHEHDSTLVFSPVKATWFLIIITTILRFLLAAFTGLGHGESYYFMSARELELSYFDQPGMTFWITHVFIEIFGASNLSVRAPFVLMFVGTSWFMFSITRMLYSARAGFYAVLCLNLSFVLGVTTATWLQPDGPLMFFWLSSVWVLTRIYFGKREIDSRGLDFKTPQLWNTRTFLLWGAFALCLGFTIVSKYHAAFLFFGAGMAALFDWRVKNWKWVIHPGPYLALIIAMMIASPILIWNMDNNWASFVFQGSRAGAEHQWRWDWFFQSILGQMIWLTPWIWLPLILLLPVCFYRGYLQSKLACQWPPELQLTASKSAFVFWLAAPLIVFFTVVTLWSNLGVHFHWQAPGYLILLAPLGAMLANLSGHRKKMIIRSLWVVGIMTWLLVFALAWHTETGALRAYGPDVLDKQLDRLHEDPTLEGYDYDDLTHAFETRGYANESDLFVITPRWHMTGKVAWALRGTALPVLCFHWDPRNIAFLYDQRELLGKDVIFVGRAPFTEGVPPDIAQCFTSQEKLPSIEIKRGGHVEMTLEVWRLKEFKRTYVWPYPASQTVSHKAMK